MKLKQLFIALLASGVAATAFAAADTYTIDPNHTYPSFEADHMGLSVWRGKYKKTSGTVTLDRAAKTGSIDILIDAASIDFGHEGMNKHAVKEDIFDVAKFPNVTYKSKTITFTGDVPTSIAGELTLHGVTKPVTLTINKFKCMMHPMHKKEICGADATATFSRADFGITKGLPMFSPEVKLAIQVEAIKSN
ncbi:MAG: YceI family protein [Telluria sp.]